MKFIYAFLLLFGCLLPALSFSYEKQLVVKEILTDTIVSLEKLDPNLDLKSGDLLLIYSHTSKEILGYARVENTHLPHEKITATVLFNHKNGIVRPENYLRKVDLTKRKNRDMPGRFELLYRENFKVSARYRPLVYAGVGQGFTAANLQKKEVLLGTSIMGYGLSSKVQVSTNVMSTLFKIPNASLKNTLFRNDDYEIALENGFQYFHEDKKTSYQLTMYLDMVSNSQFNSYFKMRAFTKKPEDDYLFNSEDYEKDVNLEFTFSYGYLFDNWNRLIFGPKLDVNKKKVGGNISYYIVDREFHAMLGVSSNDFSEVKLGKKAYLINLDFWWRF